MCVSLSVCVCVECENVCLSLCVCVCVCVCVVCVSERERVFLNYVFLVYGKKGKQTVYMYLIILQIYSFSVYYIILCSLFMYGHCFGKTVQVMPIKLI